MPPFSKMQYIYCTLQRFHSCIHLQIAFAENVQNKLYRKWQTSGIALYKQQQQKDYFFACRDNCSTFTVKHMEIWLFHACSIFQALSGILWRIHRRVHTLFILQSYNKRTLDGEVQAKRKMHNTYDSNYPKLFEWKQVLILWKICESKSHNFILSCYLPSLIKVFVLCALSNDWNGSVSELNEYTFKDFFFFGLLNIFLHHYSAAGTADLVKPQTREWLHCSKKMTVKERSRRITPRSLLCYSCRYTSEHWVQIW